jgi:hypothetical protein
MPSKFVDVTSRHFNPTSAPGLSDEARRAVNAAFDAMSAWRTETVSDGEKSFEQVVDKMAAAARAMGWPNQIVDATPGQMQATTKMQVEMMDHLMDAWEEEIKSPSQSSAMLSKLKSMPNLGSAVGRALHKWRLSIRSVSTCKSRNSGKRHGPMR